MSLRAVKATSNLLMERTEVSSSFQVGGHYPAILESRKNRTPGRNGYNSARACLYAVLMKVRPDRVFLPNYMCDAVFKAVMQAGCQVTTYSIGNDFMPNEPISVSDNEVILVPNYFGLCRDVVLTQLDRFPRSSVIVDCSQAYFEPRFDCLATIYSPRKFLPVADGGFVASDLPLEESPADDVASIARYQYLLRSQYLGTAATRTEYLAAEASFDAINNNAISTLTLKLVETLDVDFIARRRTENFDLLSELDELNELRLSRGVQVPLCYPLSIPAGKSLKTRLIDRQIFVPTYWPNVAPRSPMEENLVNNTLFLAVDHRLAPKDIEEFIQIIRKMVGPS